MTLLTAKDAAARLHISPALICRYCRAGRLGTWDEWGRRWSITEEELAAFSAKPRPVGNKTGRARRKVEKK